jgi:cobalt-zinc-cadmium efflux system protein
MKSHNDHNHDEHGHIHKHGRDAPIKVLLWAVILTFGFAIIEAISGWWTGSLVLLSDAGHMASDSLALAIAAFAAWIAIQPPSKSHSYGLGRAEVIGAWISSLIMVAVVIAIVIEAIERFRRPQSVAGGWVMVVATIGLILNLTIAWVLSHGERTLNVRAATLHVLGDLLGSVAALISGAVIYFKGWTTIDPLLSIFICILILFSSLQLLRESLLVLMEGVPLHIDLTKVGEAMAKVEQVISIHDLHIWTLSSGVTVLSAHIEIDNFSDWESILNHLKYLLAHDYKIEHVTLQPEVRGGTVKVPFPECSTGKC